MNELAHARVDDEDVARVIDEDVARVEDEGAARVEDEWPPILIRNLNGRKAFTVEQKGSRPMALD